MYMDISERKLSCMEQQLLRKNVLNEKKGKTQKKRHKKKDKKKQTKKQSKTKTNKKQNPKQNPSCTV